MAKSKVKVIITVRGDERVSILKHSIKALKESTIPLDIVIVEQDVEQKYTWVKKEGCKYIFAYNPGAFNRGWGFNVGVSNSKHASQLVLSDADLIVPPEMIKEAIYEMNIKKKQIILPYRSIRFVTQEQINESESFYHILSKYSLQLYTHDVSCGGICICTPEYFYKAQGYNELYEGWGCEDIDWSHKAVQLTGEHLTFNRTRHVLLHVKHSTMEVGYQSSIKHAENLALTKRIWNTDKIETIRLLRAGELQPEWGNLKKYVN